VMKRERSRGGKWYGFDGAGEDDDVVDALGHDGSPADSPRRTLPRRRDAIDHGVEVVIHGGDAARRETRGILTPTS